jgi:ligand-binding sensor domain-containing protein
MGKNTYKRLFFNKVLYILLFVQTGLFGALFAQSDGWEVYTSDNTIIADNQVNVVVVKDGVKWVGTNWGLYSFNDVNWIDYSSFLPHPQVRSIAFDNNNNLWVGTLGGLVVYDGSGWVEHNSQNSILNNQVNAIAFSEGGAAYVGTIDGLFRLDSGWSLLLDASSFEPFINVTSLAFSGDSLCIGTMNGGFGYFYNNSTSWENTTTGLIDNTLFDFAIDANNNKWLATPFGGLAAHLTNGSWLTYNSGFYAGWPSNTLKSTYVDSDGLLWVGTNEAGFFSFYLDGGVPNTVVYDSNNCGLPNDIVLDITQDGSGVFWIGTQNGLARWDQVAGVGHLFNDVVFNNPVSDYLTLSESADVSLYSLQGQLLLKNKNAKQLNLSSFTSGVYLLNTSGRVYKILKE